MTVESCVTIVGGNTRGETIGLGTRDQIDSIYGGAFLHNCVVDIRGNKFKIADANFLNCKVNLHVDIDNVRFLETVFERCTFTGKFVNCRFGYRRGESGTPNAYYRNCDFSNANLDCCDFFVGDIDSVTWPNWPNFAILNPRHNLQAWRAIEFPDELKTLSDLPLVESKPGFDNDPQALTVDLRRYGAGDFEEFKHLLQRKNYIQFHEK